MHSPLKSLLWVGSCRDDIRSFPEDVRLVMGYALYLAQAGSKHPDAKPLRGFMPFRRSRGRGRRRHSRTWTS